MKVTITSRNYEAGDSFHSHVEERLSRLDRFFNRIIEAQVTLHVEKYRHSAEVKILANGTTLLGKDISGDMRTAVDQAVEKLEKQVKKHKQKLRDRKTRENGEKWVPEMLAEQEQENPLSTQSIREKTVEIQPMWVQEAIVEFERSGVDILLFTNKDTERINVLYTNEDGEIVHIDTRTA